ncbi:GspH/FimT family pseudopilin [Thiohalophilus sp.]|uniref:GspH/FimT family pseudopilin n=1 Tax=Thiohalophilus sp. TaxID=3028392 RepID=UPI002ACEDB5D|nr:GspH/FimT family pseudopilin [Thiohalophilus sp.]MDZ7663689.1 GspH/FimT family pseudopilin [Thiohalophilus sp.]
MKTHNGFTITELVITLGVLSIMLALATPSFTQMIKSNRLATQANEFVSTLNVARSEAVKRRDVINITAADASDGNNEWGPGWEVTNSGGDVLFESDGLHPTLTLDSSNDLGSYQYQATGMIDNGDTLMLCDDRSGANGRQITITNTGRVSVGDVTCP